MVRIVEIKADEEVEVRQEDNEVQEKGKTDFSVQEGRRTGVEM